MERAHSLGAYFLADREPSRMYYRGGGPNLNSHVMFIVPSRLIGRVLKDKARLGDFIPRTNGDQDVIETVYSPRASHDMLLRVRPNVTYFKRDKNRRSKTRFPEHWHGHDQMARYLSLAGVHAFHDKYFEKASGPTRHEGRARIIGGF